ncbi:MAG: uroporphyrinogen decarboxylase family protein [Planctomycetota bacterium]
MVSATATARERVRAALAHRTPARTPFAWQFCATPEMNRDLEAHFAAEGRSWPRFRQRTEDIASLSVPYRDSDGGGSGGPWGMWGIGWKDVDYGEGVYREVAAYPLAGIDSLDALDAYPWPDPDRCDYDHLRAELQKRDPDRALRFLGFNPFETLCWMWGLEEVLCHCAANPELVVRGLEHITDYYETRLRRSLAILGAELDLVFFFDDLGSQHGPLLSPSMYREIIQPFHRRLFGAAKALAPQASVMMHSDGSVHALLPDLLDAGLEVLEAVQVECADMEPERLKADFGDRLAFHGAISVQQLLPHADADTVERECRRLVEVLGRDGGYIAAPSHAIQTGTPPENVLAMVRAVLGADDFAAAWDGCRL